MRATEPKVQSFRRGQTVARRRRGLVWRLLRPLVAALALVGLPVAGGWWMVTSPDFALREVVVAVGERVSVAWVEEALEPFMGRNLLLLSLVELEGALELHPWVKGVELHKELPDRLRVVVVERQPVAVLLREGELRYLEADGRAIADRVPVDAAASGLLRVRATQAPEGVAGALRVARELAAVAPDWRQGLSEIVVLGGEDFRLETAELPFSVLVRPGSLERKLEPLRTLLPEIEAHYGGLAAVDLRFFRWIVVQPRAAPADPVARPSRQEG
jgi:hypothetical protein